MNTYKAILDTSRSNGVIATITQFDNATLELQIVTNGEIEHAWESPQFELVAIKRDQYAVRESDQAAFTIKDAGEHLVSVDLKEQFLTCRGSTKMQLVVKDGDRLTTSVFYVMIGESLDHTIIESHRDVAVLDDLEAYIQTGREVIYDAQAIVTDLKDEMSEFNTSSSEKEAERQASELNRASKELVRIDNEETRVANEHDRVTNEEDRVTNEEERVANEHDRVTNEQNRRLAENTRIAQERARQDAELQRNSIFEENETIRKDGEKKRITNENEREKKFSSWEERETTRLKSEDNRVIQEQVRVSNEETRQRQEQTRQNQEDYRQRTYTQFNEAEASRVAKELQRQTAEEKRVAAEANRQNSYVDRENERDRQYAESENTRNDAFNQNEANRQSEYTTAERERVESEELRKSRERERETAESQRVTTERERVNAEQKRVADFNREIENIQNTMNQAVSNVNGAIDTANSTMEGIEQRAEECLPVIEQSSNEIERARVDYIGNQHSSIKKANDANVDWLLGEVNTAHYEGQHITALDTLEGQSKSAILTGQTLVNTWNKHNTHNKSNFILHDDGFMELKPNVLYLDHIQKSTSCLKPNTKYLLIVEVKDNTLPNDIYVQPDSRTYFYNNERVILYPPKTNGVTKTLLTTISDFSTTREDLRWGVYIQHVQNNVDESERGTMKIRQMLIEYQDGMENWDIPYFEGMQSVKMPVLTTTGKNLFKASDNTESSGLTFAVSKNNYLVNGTCKQDDTDFYFISMTTNVDIYQKLNSLPIGTKLSISKNNDVGKQIYLRIAQKDGSPTQYVQKYTTTNNDKDISCLVRFMKGDTFDNAEMNVQVEINSEPTSYEPYKSNILTVNEEVELRGVGDVQDELDLITGELTQRIGEYVVNELSNMTIARQNNDFIMFDITDIENVQMKLNAKVISDKFINATYQLNPTKEAITLWSDNSTKSVISITISKNKLSDNTINAMKEYLLNNNIKIQYPLSTESIKTVDLSDNHVYSYKDVTHYDCSSAEGSLVPTLSIDVPTNLPAVVARQRVTIKELEKENVALKNEIEETANSSVNGDLELMSSQFELDFRLFEIEMNLDMPMMATMRGVKSMAMTVYQQAKTLILAGKYEREDMEYKLNRYKAAGRITVEEYDELIALMDARELVD